MKLIKTFARKIADFQAVIVLSLFFFLLAPIFALVVKLIQKEDKPTWTPWDIPSDTLDDVRRQY